MVDFDNGETFAVDRPNNYTDSEDDEVIAAFLEANEDAIGYFGYAYYTEHADTLSAAAIQNADGAFVAPNPDSVADGSYNPLSRRIFMNLLNDETLAMTVPFVQFGYSDEGSALVEQTGYVVIPDSDKEEMLARVSAEGSPTDAPGDDVGDAPTAAPDSDGEEVPESAGGDSTTEAPGGSSASRLFSAASFGVVLALSASLLMLV